MAVTRETLLRQYFDIKDADKNGVLILEEVLQNTPAKQADNLKEWFKEHDTNKDGQLTWEEFKAFGDAVDARVRTVLPLYMFCSHFDKDKDEKLDQTELKSMLSEVLKRAYTDAEVQTYFEKWEGSQPIKFDFVVERLVEELKLV